MTDRIDTAKERDELVAQLRGWDHCWPAPWLETAVADAADQIERDGREIERLREASAEIIRLRDALLTIRNRDLGCYSAADCRAVARAALTPEGGA